MSIPAAKRPLLRGLGWAIALVACAAGGRAAVPADAIVARVNGEAVLLSQLREAAIDQQAPVAADFGADPHNPAFRRALSQYVDETLLVQAAQRDGIAADPSETAAEVDRQLTELRRQLGGKDGVDQWLDRSHLTLDGLRRILTEREKRSSLGVRVVAKGVNVDSASLAAYEAECKKTSAPLEQVNLSQILVRCPVEDQKTAKGQDRYVEAIRIAREAGRDPSKFADIAAQSSDDIAGRQRGGALGWIDPASLRPALRDRAAKMKQGDVSAPIPEEDGYHILLLAGRRTTRDLAFADLFEKRRAELLKQLRDKAQIQLYDINGSAASDASALFAGDSDASPVPHPTPPPAQPVLPSSPLR